MRIYDNTRIDIHWRTQYSDVCIDIYCFLFIWITNRNRNVHIKTVISLETVGMKSKIWQSQYWIRETRQKCNISDTYRDFLNESKVNYIQNTIIAKSIQWCKSIDTWYFIWTWSSISFHRNRWDYGTKLL